MDLSELYQELIIDHGTKPRNHRCIQDPSCTAEGFNPMCGDKVIVYIKLYNNKIEQITFDGQGCAISMASASIMTEILRGLNIDQAKDIFTNFKHLTLIMGS
jgi:nitrogen fixation NifU-like protein